MNLCMVCRRWLPGGRLPDGVRQPPVRVHAVRHHAGALVRHQARDAPEQAHPHAQRPADPAGRLDVLGADVGAAAVRRQQLLVDEHLHADGGARHRGRRLPGANYQQFGPGVLLHCRVLCADLPVAGQGHAAGARPRVAHGDDGDQENDAAGGFSSSSDIFFLLSDS